MKKCKSCGTILTIELFAKRHLGHNLDFCVSCLIATFTKIAEEEGIYVGVDKETITKAKAAASTFVIPLVTTMDDDDDYNSKSDNPSTQ